MGEGETSEGGAAGFDFWLGEWDCDVGAGEVARNTVTRVLGGRVIHERFESASLNGESHSVFDEAAQRWYQTWVDDHGAYLPFIGRKTDGSMVLLGQRPGGEPSGMRMRWHDIRPEGFLWDYEKRSPSGEWVSQWHIAYRRRAAV